MLKLLINRFPVHRIPLFLRIPLRNGLVMGIAVAFCSIFFTNQFKSEARILPGESNRSGGGQMAAAAAAAGMFMPSQDSSDSAYVDVVASRWMAKRLLMENYKFTTRIGYLGPRIHHQETLFSYLNLKSMDRSVKKLKTVVTTVRDLKSKLLTITVETPSPELSQQMVHKIVSDLEMYISVRARTKGGDKVAFTAQRLLEAQELYKKTAQETEAFMNLHRNYATSNEPAIRIAGDKLDTDLKLRQQVVASLTLNYEQSLLEQKNDMPILNILDEGDLPTDKSGPPRLLAVLISIVMVGGGTWLWGYMGTLERAPRPDAASRPPSGQLDDSVNPANRLGPL